MTDLKSSLKGSMLENFFPAAWDLGQWDSCIADKPEAIFERQDHWNKDFNLKMADDVADFNVLMGHELAMEIFRCRKEGRNLVLILPAGPMGMYRWACHFLQEWAVSCDHVSGFTMDEWSDKHGNTLSPDDPRSFQYALEAAFYEKLADDCKIPAEQQFFASKEMIVEYADRIESLRGEGAKLVVVYGIGRACHIAFWEPHFGEEFDSDKEWQNQTHRVGAMLHPLTIEQNALTSFKSRTTRVPAFANTIGPALFSRADYAIGGADGEFGRGMQWQGLSLWVTLRHQVTRHIPSTWMSRMPGILFFTKALAGPLEAETN